ncbi:MAG TPA: hypothetical protein VF614_06455 [Chthoniobacteraceae bacterium]|jgi:hypothetical protein
MKTIFALVAAVVCGALADAPATREPLELLVRNSTLVIDADITEEGLPTVDELGITNYRVKVRCREAVIGEAPEPDAWVTLSLATPRPTFLHKGNRCIFFLRRGTQGLPPIHQTDIWFSAQPYSLTLLVTVKSLKEPK